MATKVASLYADVNANIGGFMSGMGTVKSTLTGVAGQLSSFAGVAAAAMSAAAIGALAFQKALEFGDQGAQILQTRDAFNRLATSLGQGPELLNELTKATRGTVTEFDLMRSTSTLLMGTSGELGRALAENAPQLARIAQAAHDLNPTMGTTAEMYDRLARGIKKAEPELLDEVGILMNLTQVYKQYAEAHGITVSAMDKTMKTDAMLQAVLTQGNTLIEQAGQVSTKTSDSIDRMQVAMENAGNAAKEMFAPAMATVADAITEFLSWTPRIEDNLINQSRVLLDTAGSYREYAKAVTDAANLAGYWVDKSGRLRTNLGGVADENYRLSSSSYETSKGFDKLYSETTRLSAGMEQLGIKEHTQSISLSDQAIAAWSDRMAQGTNYTYASSEAIDYANQRLNAMNQYYAQLEAAEQNRIMTAGLAAGIQGTLGQATEQYRMTVSELVVQEQNLTAQLVDLQERGYGPTSAKVMELNEALTKNREQQGQAHKAVEETTAQMIFQQAAAGLDTQAALDLARSMGVLSEQDYVVASSIQALRNEFDLNHDGMISASEGASQYASSVDLINQAAQNLIDQNLPITFENLTKEMKNITTTNASKEMENVGQAAGTASGNVNDVASAAGDAEGSLARAADAADDAAEGFTAASSAGPKAAEGVAKAAGEADKAIEPLSSTAEAAGAAAKSLKEIPSSTKIQVVGAPAAITALNNVATAANNIPRNITITVRTVNLGGSGTGGTGGGGGGSQLQYDYLPPLDLPPVSYYETYNIYDPLAAVMLAQQKRLSTAQRLEAVMNG